MKLRAIGVLVCSVLLLAAMPTASFHLGSLEVGKAAAGVPRSPGRPLVIVAFASWCIGCVEELPQVVSDYSRFKDRVDFLGVDYLDNPKAGEALIKKYRIAFPVVQLGMNENAAPPADPNSLPSGDWIRLTGMTPQMLPAALPQLEAQLPAVRPRLDALAAFCKTHTAAQCVAYGKAHNVLLSGASTSVSRKEQASTPSSHHDLALPHLFVIDANGVVRSEVTGYDSGVNAIAAQLAKLGIK